MALLASCWLIVESFIIPDGFVKWFYLSFYIHPLFLVFSHLFLCLIQLNNYLLILFFPLSIPFRLCLQFLLFLFSFTKPSTVEVYYDALGTIPSQDCQIEAGNACRFAPNLNQTSCVEDSWLNKYLYSDHYSSSTYDADVFEIPMFPSSFVGQPIDHTETTNQAFIIIQESEDSESGPSHSFDPHHMLTLSQESSSSPLSSSDFNESSGSNSPFTPLKQQPDITIFKQDIDPFHHMYTSRMTFFNLLYHERLHGMNAILNEHLTSDRALFGCTARKSILKSLECDIEMIYVAQSCLLWEALFHQYHKVEALTFSDNSENKVFHHTISIKFQELEILLVRYVEDQKWEFQGSSSNFIQRRICFQSLLQVPDATGFMFAEEENKSIKASELLEGIYKCIRALWSYIKTDNKKMWWKYESIWRSHPPVEDPQDLQLLYSVTKTLHKKGIMLKDVEGKSKCLLRRKVKAMHESRNVVFAMIDMKLVERVLKMSIVCNSHLKWCLQKLHTLDFKDGKLFRGHITHLFPSS